MNRSIASPRRSLLRRAAPVALASMLISVSPALTTSAYALDTITAVLLAGETLSTGTEATLTDPTATSVTVPVAGTVSITEGAVAQTAPSGREFFGQEVDIAAPLALTVLDPIKMVFRFDASALPTGVTAPEIRMFRNGTELSPCTGAVGTASPDPCASSVSIDATTGDLEIVALTSAASKWNAGRVKAVDGGGAMTVSPGSVVASSTDNDLAFTFKASSGGMDGQIEMTIPSGWSAPQSTDAAGAGYLSVATGTCSAAPNTRLLSIAGMLATIDMQCSYKASFSIGYANAAAPTTFADHEFTTKTKLDGGTLTAIAVQPKVSTAAGALSTFAFSTIGSVTAGTQFTASVTAKDALGNTITTYSGTPTISHDLSVSTKGCGEGGGSPCSPSANLGSFSSGSATLTATAYRAETGRRFTVTDGSITSGSGTFGTVPSGASELEIAAPEDATAGTAVTATVTAYDMYGNVASDYRGSVSFGSSDAYASLPADHAFSAADAGTKLFSVTLETAGLQTITVEGAAPAFTATDSVNVTDVTIPTVTISEVSPALVKLGESATVTWSSNERGTFSVRVGGSSCTDGSVVSSGSQTGDSHTVSIEGSALAEGTNVVRVCLTDSGGNTGGASETVTKDSIAPDAAITSSPSGTLNTASISFGFRSSDAAATLSCRMTGGDGVVIFAPSVCTDGTKTYDIAGLGDGTYTFSVTATDAAGNSDATPAMSAFTIDRAIPQTDRMVAELEAGEVASSGIQPTGSDVIVTSVRVVTAGSVMIEETSIARSDPQGWNLFGQQVNITAPPATSFDDPLRLTFTISLASVPPGYDASEVSLFKNGSLVGPCSPTAVDPCFTRVVAADSLELSVLTTTTSEWTFGVPEAPPVTRVPPQSPADSEPPQVVWTQRGRYISPNGDGRRDDMTLSATFSEPTVWDLSMSRADDNEAKEEPGSTVSLTGSGTEFVASWSDMRIDRDVPDGTYVWTLRGQDESGNHMEPVSGSVVIDRTNPVISSVQVVPLSPSARKRVTIGFAVSEAARVRVKVKRAGSVVKTFARKTVADAGNVTLVWSGRDDNRRFVRPGAYRLVIKAVDRGAVRTIDRSTRLYIRN